VVSFQFFAQPFAFGNAALRRRLLGCAHAAAMPTRYWLRQYAVGRIGFGRFAFSLKKLAIWHHAIYGQLRDAQCVMRN